MKKGYKRFGGGAYGENQSKEARQKKAAKKSNVARPFTPEALLKRSIRALVCTENLIRVADVMESPKLAE